MISNALLRALTARIDTGGKIRALPDTGVSGPYKQCPSSAYTYMGKGEQATDSIGFSWIVARG
ncbi:hypothetical protein GCM10011487_08890 [Steroidobacter agaridevorans]|uniref:Uncharacterized protein n=1 Tax=Steroidobacter agaridevorans TaxID=2695856 RepID=A0A829Y6L7_9GAMM|nr:hypothetical protein GCM10011487_08890 [Steroidobacter agaridevorans]